MWKFLARSSAAVFGVCVVLMAIGMKWRTGHVEWGVVITIAILATGFFAARSYVPLRAERRRQFMRAARSQKRARLRALGAAVNELIDSMARLSPGDLSLYHTILHSSSAGDTARILTSQGSANHDVLVQMTDLKLATPEEFKTFGTAPNAFTSVRYALTPFGRSYLAKLMAEVLQLRGQHAQG